MISISLEESRGQGALPAIRGAKGERERERADSEEQNEKNQKKSDGWTRKRTRSLFFLLGPFSLDLLSSHSLSLSSVLWLPFVSFYMMIFPFSWCDYSTNSICLLFLDGYGEKGKRPTLSEKLKSSKGGENGGSEEINRREGKKNRTPGEGGKGSCLFVCLFSLFLCTTTPQPEKRNGK